MIRKHLLKRNMNSDIHTVWINDIEDQAVFPLWNLSGQMVGYQKYDPSSDKTRKNSKEGKYHTWRNKAEVSVWGLESWNLSDVLFITEGIFDACRLTNKGYSAIALLSNNPNASTKRWLWSIRNTRKVVSVSDPGEGGKFLKTISHVDVNCNLGNDIDLGDAPEWWVDNLCMEHGHN